MAKSDRFINLTPRPSSEPASATEPCPKCRSKNTLSAAKRPTSDSYWRCLDCGDVWSPALMVGTKKGGPEWWQR